MIRITTERADARFGPGEALRGRVEWSTDAVPDALELRLIWYTEGRGDRDVGLARRMRFEGVSSADARDFEFELPAGPYSCSGRLISIRWAVEAALLPDEWVERLEFVLAPDGREVELRAMAS